MSPFEQNKITQAARGLSVAVTMAVLLFASSLASAAAQGETGNNFTLSASAAYVSMPDGASSTHGATAARAARCNSPARH